MFLRDACDQPVSSAWIGSICSHVALEKWSWHPCSPVSPPSSGQCSCWSSSPPAPVHSRLCVTVLPTRHPGAFLVALCSAPEQCDIKLDRRKAISPQCSLCQSSVALFFPWWPLGWIPSPHQHIPPCSGDLLPPCLSTGNLLLEGAFFCSKCYKKFYSWDGLCLTLWFSSKWKRELPCRVLLFPPLLASCHSLSSHFVKWLEKNLWHSTPGPFDCFLILELVYIMQPCRHMSCVCIYIKKIFRV